MPSIYEKIFGKVKTGSSYTSNSSTTSGYSGQSLRASMRKFRAFVYGGGAGANLSRKDAQKIIDLLEPKLKNLRPGKKLGYSTKASLKSKLWGMVKKGELSHEDYKDGKKIIDQF